MGDPTRETGVYRHTDESGKSVNIVKLAGDMKIILGAVGALIAVLGACGIWFNGYVQAKATEGLAQQIGTSDSAIRTAFESMIDARAEEIEANVIKAVERNRDLESIKLDQLKSMIWKATNPSRHVNAPEPEWEGLPDDE
jgi:hypothetical protein